MTPLYRLRVGLVMLGLLGLASCYNGFDSPGHWNVTQANQINLAAQASDWHDLMLGHGDPGADGQEAAAAVDRLRRGIVKPLPMATASDIASQSTAAPAAAGPGAAPGSN